MADPLNNLPPLPAGFVLQENKQAEAPPLPAGFVLQQEQPIAQPTAQQEQPPKEVGAWPSSENMRKYAMENIVGAASEFGKAAKNWQEGDTMGAAGRGTLGVLGAAGAIPSAAIRTLVEDPVAKMTGSEGAGEVAGLAAGIAIPSASEKVRGATVVAPVLKGAFSPAIPKLEKMAADLHQISQNTVNTIKESGINFHPGVAKKIASELERSVSGISGSLARRVEPVLKEVDAAIQDLRSGNGSLANLFFQRKTLSEMANQGGDVAPIARKAMEKMDKVLNTPGLEKLIVSGPKNPEAVGLISRFNKEYGTAKNFETLMDIIKPGEDKMKLSSGQMRAKLAKLVDSPGFDYFSSEVQKMIKQGARGKTSERILGAVGNIRGLFSLGQAGLLFRHGLPIAEAGAALYFGQPAAAAGIAGITGADAAARQMTKGAVWDILKAIKAGK